MTRLAFLAIATAAALTAVPASAADLYRRQQVQPSYTAAPVAAYNWSGAYLGLNAGYSWGDLSNSTLSPSGFVGGLTAGANWQFGQIVVGPEFDIMYSGVDDGHGGLAGGKWQQNWLGTARGRLGVAFDRFLPYVTGGLAFGNSTLTTPTFKDDATNVGWTLGLGLEGAVTQNVSAKIEYLYYDLGEKSYGNQVVKNGFDGNLVRAGINYRF